MTTCTEKNHIECAGENRCSAPDLPRCDAPSANPNAAHLHDRPRPKTSHAQRRAESKAVEAE